MDLRFDGYYLSDRQRTEEWHAGVHMVEDYYEYLKLFEDGLFLRKSHPTPDFDFSAYLGKITQQAFQDGLAGRHPLDADYDFLHQTGRFIVRESTLEFEFRHFLVIMHEFRRNMRIISHDRLVSESGAEYAFHPFEDAATLAAESNRKRS
jgi:hypothetical protein